MVNGTYSLLPCAFNTSSRTHASDRSFGAGCPAAASSTTLTTLWISFFCASSRFFSSLLCASRPIEHTRAPDMTSANTPRRCFIKPCLPHMDIIQTANHRRRFAGKSNPSARSTSGALHALALCYYRRFRAVPAEARTRPVLHEAHRRLGPARFVARVVPQQPAVQPGAGQAPVTGRQLERIGAASERARGHACRRAPALLRRGHRDRGAAAGDADRPRARDRPAGAHRHHGGGPGGR